MERKHMKRKQLAAIAAAGAIAIGLGIHSAGATTLPTSGLSRTVASTSSFPGSWNVTSSFTVTNLTTADPGLPPAPVVVTCSLQTKAFGATSWTPIDSDRVFIAGGLQNASDLINLDGNVEATVRFNARVQCRSSAGAAEPTVVSGASIAVGDN
jgi:hypothetical protein